MSLLKGFRKGRSVNNPHGTVLDEGNLRVLDALGRELHVGDMVILHGQLAPRARIVDIKPVLHPQAPPGLMQVLLHAQFGSSPRANHPAADMLRVATREEIEGPREDAEANGSNEPPAGPSLVPEN